MTICTIPPLDDLEDRGFWMTHVDHVPGLDHYRIIVVFGLGLAIDKAFIVVQSKASKEELAAYSISEKPSCIWGKSLPEENAILSLISSNFKALIDHWKGEIDSLEIAMTLSDLYCQ